MLSAEYMQPILDDPVIVEAIRRSHQANYRHWVTANISHPGDPVSVNRAAEPLAAVRYTVRHGLDERMVLDGYRIAQNVACRSWMRLALRLTSDRAELRELLDVSTRSIASFLGDTVAELCRQMRVEQDQFTIGSHAERRALVARVLEGGEVFPQEAAEDRIGYRLDREHIAAVVWDNESRASEADLDQAAEALMQACGDRRRPLSVPADAETRWIWLPGAEPPGLAGVATTLSRLPGVRIAIGPAASGIDGFRRSHLDALFTQRVMMRISPSQRIAKFTDIELATLVFADSERADRFITRTLGDFESAEAELQQVVLTYIREQCNVSRAAKRLFVHRNTLIRRLAHANSLLPLPIEENSTRIATALETLPWRPVAH